MEEQRTIIDPQIKELVDLALDMFNKYGEVEPVILLDIEGEDAFIRVEHYDAFESKENKIRFGKALRQFVPMVEEKHGKVNRIIILTEVWLSEIDKGDEEKVNKVMKEGTKGDENRKEGLMINIETKKDNSVLFYEIIKDGDNAVISDYPVKHETVMKEEKGGLKSIFQVWE